MTTAKAKAPWKRPRPAGKKHHTLSAAQKAKAKATAKKAGRHYPNLIDNMRVAKSKKKASAK